MPSSGLRHQMRRRIGDVDRPVIGLHPALVGFAIGRVCFPSRPPTMISKFLNTLVLYINTFGSQRNGMP